MSPLYFCFVLLHCLVKHLVLLVAVYLVCPPVISLENVKLSDFLEFLLLLGVQNETTLQCCCVRLEYRAAV